jgi:hypothetical protein
MEHRMADSTNPTANKSLASNLLPRFYRTDSNKKFLQATVDQLIQPGTVKKVNGFVGRKTAKATGWMVPGNGLVYVNGHSLSDYFSELKHRQAIIKPFTVTDKLCKYNVWAIAENGGSGVITPDLTIEESSGWIDATDSSVINPIYVVAPSTKDARLAQVTSKCGGFVYAASLMGVTGARATVSSGAADLVARVRKVTDLPIAVGLGVSTREQAKGVAAYADGVIVGSAFIKAMQDAPSEEAGLVAVTELARELAKGVREGR